VNSEYPDVKIPSGLLFKIIKESAVRLNEYSHLDQDSGYINVEKAYAAIKKYIDGDEIKNYEEYTISTLSPNMPDGKGECLYLRNGKYLTGKESISFSVNRNNFINRDKFYRIYDLRSDSDWLVSIQSSIYLRNEQSASVQVKFDTEKMKEPGLYNGKIFASRSDKSKIPEFSLMTTVVIPYEFTNENNGRLTFSGKLAPGKIDRYFVNIPAGSSAMRITLLSKEGEYTCSKFRIHDPEGKDFYVSPTLNSIEDDSPVSKTFYDLMPGVYEIAATGFYKAKDSSNFNLKVELDGIKIVENKVLTMGNSFIQLINNSNNVKQYTLSGLINGYEKEYDVDLSGIKEIPFTLNSEIEQKVFNFSLSKNDYNKITDFAFLIVDEQGVVKAKSSLSYKDGKLILRNKNNNDSTNYTLRILPGFTHSGSSLTLKIREENIFKNKEGIDVTNQSRSVLSIYPSVIEKIVCEISPPKFIINKDEKYIGKIYLTPNSENGIKLEIPVHIKLLGEVI
jgi:hypothetical protein